MKNEGPLGVCVLPVLWGDRGGREELGENGLILLVA